MADFTNVVVIYNPNSTGSSKDMAEAFVAGLEHLDIGIPLELIATEHAGHATEIALEVAKKYDRPLIVSSSGDGGYNEVINGALRAQFEGADPVCAVLAAGNANDHRRTIRRRPLVDAVKMGAVERIDVLEASIESSTGNTRRFAHSYIGIGLSPEVAVELNRTSINRFKEALIVIKSLGAFHPVRIDVGGKQLVVDSMIFANISEMAKFLTVAKDAQPDDGYFRVVTFPYKHKLHLLFRLAKALLGTSKGVSTKSYEFRAVNDMLLQFDGEIEKISEGDKVSIVIRPRTLATLR